MTYLLTGAAGFIGMHTAKALLARGETVVGVDSLNSYYDPALKHARLKQLENSRFHFIERDIADPEALQYIAHQSGELKAVIHLAAQAGVRYSLKNPFAYTHSNINGQLSVLELMRQMPQVPLIYASSSSVYGANTQLPWSVKDPVDHPVSLYAATKRAGELMTESYVRLHGLKATGLRFFTVYGPWGRPDMAPWLFTEAVLKGEEIALYNHGQMQRDFTYIDDIVQGILGAIDHSPKSSSHRLYNLGNHQPVALLDFVHAIENATGQKARLQMHPMQPGDVVATYAEISESEQDLGFIPTVSLNEGITHFVDWYQSFRLKNSPN